jgi:hypothetical protein
MNLVCKRKHEYGEFREKNETDSFSFLSVYAQHQAQIIQLAKKVEELEKGKE